EPDRRERRPRLLSELLDKPAQILLDRARLPRRKLFEAVGRRRDDLAVDAVGRRDVLEQEANEVGVLRELLDLLLHERCGREDALLRPVDVVLLQPPL